MSTSIVYKLQRFTLGTNLYGVSRSEQWTFIRDSTFASDEEAKNYIREKHRTNSEFIILAQRLEGDVRERFLDNFSFENDMYLTKRTYFLGDHREELVSALLSDGVQIN